MQTELGKLKTENEIMRNRLNSLVSNNNKQTDEYICVDREHGLWKRKEPKEPNVNADRLALALSLETIQELERENAELNHALNIAQTELRLNGCAKAADEVAKLHDAARKEAQP